MALVDLASVASLLACPRCGFPLVEHEDARYHGEGCELCSSGFGRAGRWPVLIDPDASILNRNELALPEAGKGSLRWSVNRVPRLLRWLWKPPNRVATRNIERLLELVPGKHPLVLVVGGGSIGNGVEALYADRGIRVVAFDLTCARSTQLVADAHDIPLSDASADAVVVQAVLEHVLDPVRVVGEIHRVLRHGGIVYAETPFLQHVHAGAYDFVRYTASGHRYLFRAFEEISAGPVAGPGTQLLWSVDHLVRGLTRSELAGKLARTAFFWLRPLDRLVAPEFALDSASAYYFLGRRADRVLTAAEIVDYYRGAQGGRARRGAGLD